MKTDPLYRDIVNAASEPMDPDDLEDNARRHLAHWRRPYP